MSCQMKVFLWYFLGNKQVSQVSLRRSFVSFPRVQSDHYCYFLQGMVISNWLALVSFSSECLYRCIHPHTHTSGQGFHLLKITILISQKKSMFSHLVSNQENHKIGKSLLIFSLPFYRPTLLTQNFFFFL